MADRDWPAFWRSLLPSEQWEAAKAMPKIAGPWEGVAAPCAGEWCRRDVNGNDVLWQSTGGSVYTQKVRGLPKVVYPDRASADAALRAAGWILVDEPEEGGRG